MNYFQEFYSKFSDIQTNDTPRKHEFGSLYFYTQRYNILVTMKMIVLGENNFNTEYWRF